MKILHSADWHLDVRRRFVPHVQVLLRMIEKGIADNVDAFVFAGDFGFDSPHHLRTKELLALIDIFSLASLHAPTIVIPGNHDEVEQFKLFEKINFGENFHIFNDPNHAIIETRSGPLGIVAVPWLGKRAVMQLSHDESIRDSNILSGQVLIDWTREALISLPSCEHRIVVAHYAVPGAFMGSVEVSSAYDMVFDVDQLDDLPIDYIALGHLHLRQSCGIRKRSWYPGSPVPLDFSETGIRGFHIVQIRDDERTGHPIFVPNDTWTMKTLHMQFDGNSIDGDMEDSYENAVVRVNVDIPANVRLLKKNKIFTTLEKTILSRGALGVKINRNPARVAERPPPVFLSQVSVSARLEAIMEEYGYDDDRRKRLMDGFQLVRSRWGERQASTVSPDDTGITL